MILRHHIVDSAVQNVSVFVFRVKFGADSEQLWRSIERFWATLLPTAFWLLSIFLAFMLYSWNHFSHIANVFKIWSTQAGYEEYAVGFEPIGNGEIFEWIIMYLNQKSSSISKQNLHVLVSAYYF